MEASALRQAAVDYDCYGFPGGNAMVLRAILGREPRTLSHFFAELASQEDKKKE